MKNNHDTPCISPIKQVELLASRIPDVVSLAQGIPSFDTPEVIKRAAVRALDNGCVSKYSLTYGLSELRRAIQADLTRSGMHYDWEHEIIITCGATEAITATLIALLSEQKNEVIIPSPSYASYQEIIKVAGGKPIFTPLQEDQEWALDIGDLTQRVSPSIAAVLLANPNNPTGTLFTKDQLRDLAQLACEHGFYIILDEVYKDFIYDDNYQFYSLAQDPSFRDIVIRAYSFSKAFAMTGWRVAYVHSDKNIIDRIIAIHDSLVTCTPVVSQYAALAAIEHGHEHIARFRSIYRTRRDLICSRLDRLRHVFSYQIPDSAYFVFPKILDTDCTSWQCTRGLLEHTRVAVVPGNAFGPSGEHHIRLCFGRSEHDIATTFDRLDNYFVTNGVKKLPRNSEVNWAF